MLTGTFKCVICDLICDGSEVVIEPGGRKTCSDYFCGANVRKISDKPKAEYDNEKKSPEAKPQ